MTSSSLPDGDATRIATATTTVLEQYARQLREELALVERQIRDAAPGARAGQ